MIQKKATTQVEINDTIASRWSPRAFDKQRAVTSSQIIALLEAARWAPSCFGDQPWRFVVCDKTQNPSAWDAAYACLSPGNQSWVANTSLIILVCADTLFGHNQQPNRWAQYDTGAAAENLCLQATSLGLAAHQMGGFDPQQARTAFAIPEQFTLMSMIAIGYQAPAEDLPDDLREREIAERKRKSLAELCYAGMWDKPVV